MDLYGEMSIWKIRGFLSKTKRPQTTRPFYPSAHATLVLEDRKKSVRKLVKEQRKKILSQFFFATMTITWPGTATFGFGQTLIASPFLVRWRQMMACWNHLTKGSSIFAIWQGAETNTKNICWGQTVSTGPFQSWVGCSWSLNFTQAKRFEIIESISNGAEK